MACGFVDYPALPRIRAARPVVGPANRPDVLERARILTVVNSTSFVDLPPIQIYAQLLDAGVYVRKHSPSMASRRSSAQIGARL